MLCVSTFREIAHGLENAGLANDCVLQRHIEWDTNPPRIDFIGEVDGGTVKQSSLAGLLLADKEEMCRARKKVSEAEKLMRGGLVGGAGIEFVLWLACKRGLDEEFSDVLWRL